MCQSYGLSAFNVLFTAVLDFWEKTHICQYSVRSMWKTWNVLRNSFFSISRALPHQMIAGIVFDCLNSWRISNAKNFETRFVPRQTQTLLLAFRLRLRHRMLGAPYRVHTQIFIDVNTNSSLNGFTNKRRENQLCVRTRCTSWIISLICQWRSTHIWWSRSHWTHVERTFLCVIS